MPNYPKHFTVFKIVGIGGNEPILFEHKFFISPYIEFLIILYFLVNRREITHFHQITNIMFFPTFQIIQAYFSNFPTCLITCKKRYKIEDLSLTYLLFCIYIPFMYKKNITHYNETPNQ